MRRHNQLIIHMENRNYFSAEGARLRLGNQIRHEIHQSITLTPIMREIISESMK